jgi:sarcosine oxidase
VQPAQQKRYDVIVVGAGLMGAASAWSLARRGRSVLLVDQDTQANPAGSSHGSARIVRRAYGDELYTRLTGRAFEHWRELELQSGTSLLRMLGGVDFGHRDVIAGIAESLAHQRVEHELMSIGEAEALWPGLRFEGTVVHHPQAGTVDAAAAVHAFVAVARRSGAEFLERSPVTGLRPAAEGAKIELAGGSRIQAASVVIAAGAWTASLVEGTVDLPSLAVTQQQIFHFPRREASALPWPSVIHQDAQIYHLAGGRDGGDDRKIAEHRCGTPTTAEGRSGVVDPRSRERIVEYVRRWLPGLEPTPRREASCLYTSTANEDFLLDRVGPLVICSACSGHGAKFAPLIGELVADLTTAPDRAEIPARFRLESHRRGRRRSVASTAPGPGSG